MSERALGGRHSFPGFIAAMSDLVKALNNHVLTKDWDKNVASKLDKFAAAVSQGMGVGGAGNAIPLFELLLR